MRCSLKFRIILMVSYNRPTFDAYHIYAIFCRLLLVTWTSSCYNCSFLRFLISKHRSLFSRHVFAKVCPLYSFKEKFEGPSLEQILYIFKCYDVLTTVLTSTDNDTCIHATCIHFCSMEMGFIQHCKNKKANVYL